MARRADGFKLYADTRTGNYYVRFSHDGRRFHVLTSERDRGAASRAAAEIYANVVSGRWAPGKRVAPAPAGTPFIDVAAIWLADIEPTIDPRTFKLYRDVYMGSRFAPFCETIDRLNSHRRRELHRGTPAAGHPGDTPAGGGDADHSR